MGMYDSFYFAEGLLPNNEETSDMEFQSKCLKCNLDKFYFDSDGFVTKKPFDECEENDKPINEGLYVYSYNFDMKPTRYQEYKILIMNSKLVYVERINRDD